MGIIIASTPFGSLLSLPPEERATYRKQLFNLPTDSRKMLFDKHTGAFVRGMAKSYGVSDDRVAVISLAIYEVVIGKRTLVQLPSVLSTELGLSGDQAQKMADEIERDLLASVRDELEEYWRKDTQQKSAPASSDSSGLSNVLNLKDQPPPPPPPPPPPMPDSGNQ